MLSASMSAIVITVFFAALFVRHVSSLMQVAVIVRDDIDEARARRHAAMQAWDQRTIN